MMTQPRRLLLLDEIFEGAPEEDVKWLIDMLRRYVAETGVKLVVVEHVIRAVRAMCAWLFVLD